MEFYDFPFRNGNGIIIPTDFQSIIFQRARAKNHQPVVMFPDMIVNKMLVYQRVYTPMFHM